MDDIKEKKEQILKAKNLFEKADLENKVISLAEKAAKNGFYDDFFHINKFLNFFLNF